MYKKAYGIIETLAPLHVGASAGEESGNLNLIFRDQFTQTGIIPGSSIRGRFRADMRQDLRQKNEGYKDYNYWYGQEAPEKGEAAENKKDTTEALVKFEYASIVWLPVYCPNQPVVWVSCPRLLKRYQKLSGKTPYTFTPHTYYGAKDNLTKLFFNLGFIRLDSSDKKLGDYIPDNLENLQSGRDLVLIVSDTEISMIHDMALYRQSRVALDANEKKAKGGAFFNVEALPEGTILTFPTAIKNKGKDDNSWQEYIVDADIEKTKELYFGGLESIGFGRTNVTLYEGLN
ncbi:RAMP superfamily CRISPR-associated protein [Pseudanabaena sp. BC1403]|uniref:RAMP superfamily CRISPR-associated protein n=1 Tax=Pseudanabaena sp. BC1403 TaxID=2043171 RepID=UPI000CD819C4|nr:RAMP superfamily CRISPR-associated protein [Pseudanabaena sp. BC1403]